MMSIIGNLSIEGASVTLWGMPSSIPLLSWQSPILSYTMNTVTNFPDDSTICLGYEVPSMWGCGFVPSSVIFDKPQAAGAMNLSAYSDSLSSGMAHVNMNIWFSPEQDLWNDGFPLTISCTRTPIVDKGYISNDLAYVIYTGSQQSFDWSTLSIVPKPGKVGTWYTVGFDIDMAQLPTPDFTLNGNQAFLIMSMDGTKSLAAGMDDYTVLSYTENPPGVMCQVSKVSVTYPMVRGLKMGNMNNGRGVFFQ